MPADWEKIDAQQQNFQIMQMLRDIKAQNTIANNNIAKTLQTVNFHSELLKAHEDNIFDLQTNLTDIENAVSNNSPRSQIIITGIPSDVALVPEEIVSKVFAHINFDNVKYGTFILAIHAVKPKNPDQASLSLIVNMISDAMCEHVLELAAAKRNGSPMSNKDIFGDRFVTNIYINKVLPQYTRDLAYQARRLKASKGWFSTWVNRGSVFVRTTQRADPTRVTSLTHLKTIM